MASREPSGAVESIDSAPNLVLERRFEASAADIWADLTESSRLERWVGRWEGDPASGVVRFAMTAEGEDAPAEDLVIHECTAPRRFAGEASVGDSVWPLWFELHEDARVTTLRFGQRLGPQDDVGSIGPGWEYYLDRLVAVREGRDAASVAWDDYFPAMQSYYETLVAGG